MFDNMTGILVPILLVLIAILGIGFVLGRLYRRTSRDTAFVRTGLGGRKVIIDGGAVILPVFHSIALVNLNTLRIEVKRDGPGSLITKDRLRADITVEFYVRVEPTGESIAIAAQTLGERTNDERLLSDLVEAKFVDALRSVAAGMTLPELQEKRADFVKGVQDAVSQDLQHNGLVLESASLTRLDQTSIDFFNPDNSFDAEGLTALKRITEERRRERNQIVRDAEVAVAEKDRDTSLKQLEITQQTQVAQLNQSRDIANRTAETRAETARAEQAAQRAELEAQIEREQAIQLKNAEARKAAETATIQADLAIAKNQADSDRERQMILQDNAIQIAEKSKAESEAQTEAREAEALAVSALEKVTTARSVEIAERERQVSTIAAKKEAERAATGITVNAEAEREAAESRSKATIMLAEAEATAARSKAEAIKEIGEAEAEADRLRNSAKNELNEAARAYDIDLKRLQTLPDALEASMKAVEKIDTIRIFDAGNLMGSGPGGGEAAGSYSGRARGSFSDGLSDHLLRYQWNAPMMNAILDQAGFSEGSNSVNRLMSAVSGKKAVAEKPASVQPAEEAPAA